MRSTLLIVRASWLLLSVCVILSVPAFTWPQQLGTKESLKKGFSENPGRRDKLFLGEEAASGKADMKIAEHAANYYLHRITHAGENPDAVQKEFALKVGVMMEKGRTNQAFINMFGPALVASMKQVFLDRDVKADPTVVIHAGQMLPTMAKLKQADIGDYLVELIKYETNHDVIRLHALKAMREMLPILTQPDDLNLDLTDKNFLARKNRDVKYVETLAKYIEKPVKVNAMSAEEINAVKFIRREAIIALAHAGSPAVLAFPKQNTRKQTLEGPVAPTLLRVLSKDGLAPSASLSEKIEAAIGLCHMKYPNMPEYNKEVAVYLIGQTLLEFVREYNKDRGKFTAVSIERTIPYLGWKTDAKRFNAGLKELTKNSGNNSGNLPAAVALEAKAKLVLDKIILYEAPDREGDLRALVTTPKGFRPNSGQVFKSFTAPVIPLD